MAKTEEYITMSNPSVNDVQDFWEANPLWSGESNHTPGTKPFFEEHRDVYISDCFAGQFDPRCVPQEANREKILDLGCGPGFWTIELWKHGCHNITSADLTKNALKLTKSRCEIYGVSADVSQQNAENLTFDDGSFTHVNCQGVIHHTPDTEACVAEIARVLKPGGTASLSVYYKNVFLRNWGILKWAGIILSKLGGGMKGRGREKIFSTGGAEEIVRLYDGDENPIGKAYSKQQFVEMLSPHFEVQDIYLHFFPARALPIKTPHVLHRFLDKYTGFMIYATVKKS
ncbi:class I SAM-dependent methyltransferase [Magnetococcus sp. PR-3]|uniref:class I SAM-dependent methyltransferase n=1 Tax=Magnetococcus sp. PR-3 TaxID=3120355 RepID=UPI002FCE012A